MSAAPTSHCLPKACEITLRGLEATEGQVTDVITARCELPPQKHLLQYWLDYRGPGEEFTPLTPRIASEWRIPTASGFSRTVTAPCLRGHYRTHYTVTGVGPGEDPIPFEVEGVGKVRFFDVEDCAR